MPDIEFVEGLPATRSNNWHVEDVIEKLQTRPGEWAIVERGETWNSVAPHSTRLRKRGAEAACRRISKEPSVIGLFARWPEPADQ
jgi:hypothetical protein